MTRTLEKLVEKTGNALTTHHWKIATAESCTAGGLSYWLTSRSGSSAWFERGYVTYSDPAKIEMLGVKKQTLAAFGAVSEQAAREMVEGALRKSGADVSIAITGIAGPNGGTPLKPVGTVWIAWAGKHFPTQIKMFYFPGDRASVRLQSIETALEKLLDIMKK